MHSVEFDYARHRRRDVPLIPIRTPFYLHKMRMRLEEDEFEMEVGFSAKLGVGFNLLGMDLFDRYKVTFDNAAKKVTFERG